MRSRAARPHRVSAVDLPTIRDDVCQATLASIDEAADPDGQRQMVAQLRRRDAALWWVTRTMSILAAHACEDLPEWDAVAVRPAPAGVLCWQSGSGISVPVWTSGPEPTLIEAAGVVWGALGDQVSLAPLLWRDDLARVGANLGGRSGVASRHWVAVAQPTA